MEPGTDDSVSTSLLVRARANDRMAWEKLAEVFTPIVYCWVRRGGVPEADAEDVVQEVFLEISRGLPHFHKDQPGDTFGGWLRVLTRRRICDYYRRAQARGVGGSTARVVLEQFPATPPESEPDPTDDPTAEVLRRGLELIRPEFDARTWTAFQEVAIARRPAADVAAELGMTVGAVYMAKSRLLRRLREEFEGLL